jgi:[ribosomal protein S5]-alanine N-acetyltransferase
MSDQPHKVLTFTTPEPLLTLSRPGLTIRPLLHSDAARLALLCNNIKIARNQGRLWPLPYTLDCAHDWIADTRHPKNFLLTHDLGELPEHSQVPIKAPKRWAIALNGEQIGGCGMGIVPLGNDREGDDRVGVIGYWIAEEYWGQGIMTEVLRAYVAWLWRAHPKLERLNAHVYSWNPASVGVLKKCGFELEGTSRAAVMRFGKRCDLLNFGILRDGVVIDDGAPEELPEGYND